MTKHFAVLAVSPIFAHQVKAPGTQIRKHAPEDGEGSGWLLVQLIEGRPRETLKILQRSRRRCRHVGNLRDLESLWRESQGRALKSSR